MEHLSSPWHEQPELYFIGDRIIRERGTATQRQLTREGDRVLSQEGDGMFPGVVLKGVHRYGLGGLAS